MANSNSTPLSPSVNRVILITAQRTTYASIGYGTPRRAEIRVNGRSAMAAWTHESIWNAVDALGEETQDSQPIAPNEPTSATERMQRHMVEATGIQTGNPRDAWRALFNRWAAGR